MANFVPVKKELHENLKIAAKRELKHLTGQHIVPITAAEYAQASASFPVAFVRNPGSERFRSVALLGLEAGENLYYADGKWSALMLPQSAAMAPFSLGLDPEKENTLTSCIDIDSELVGENEEHALYKDGKETELLITVEKSLGRLYENEKMTENFAKELTDNDLLHELEFLIEFKSGEPKKLNGIFTINEEKLKSLSDEKVLDFHKRGLFVPIYAMLGSLGQVNRLVQLRNQSATDEIAGIHITPVAAKEAANA